MKKLILFFITLGNSVSLFSSEAEKFKINLESIQESAETIATLCQKARQEIAELLPLADNHQKSIITTEKHVQESQHNAEKGQQVLQRAQSKIQPFGCFCRCPKKRK